MSIHVKLPSFDQLISLYKKNPAAYDSYKKELLNKEIESAPPERRPALRHMLHEIEMAHAQAETPLEAAIMAYLLMCESTSQLRTELHKLQHITSSLQAAWLIDSARIQSRKYIQ